MAKKLYVVDVAKYRLDSLTVGGTFRFLTVNNCQNGHFRFVPGPNLVS